MTASTVVGRSIDAKISPVWPPPFARLSADNVDADVEGLVDVILGGQSSKGLKVGLSAGSPSGRRREGEKSLIFITRMPAM